MQTYLSKVQGERLCKQKASLIVFRIQILHFGNFISSFRHVCSNRQTKELCLSIALKEETSAKPFVSVRKAFSTCIHKYSAHGSGVLKHNRNLFSHKLYFNHINK